MLLLIMECKFHFFFFFILTAVGAKLFLVETKDKYHKNDKHARHNMYVKHKTHYKHKKEEAQHAHYQLRKTTSQNNDDLKDVVLHNEGGKNIKEHGEEFAFSSKEFFKKPSKMNKKRSKGKKKIDKKSEKGRYSTSTQSDLTFFILKLQCFFNKNFLNKLFYG